MEENTIQDENKKNEEKKEEQEIENNQILTTEQQNELYEKIKTYFGGPNIDENGEIKDISYDWVTKNEAIKHLCEPYEVIYNSNDKNINTINNILLNNYKNNKDVTSLRNPFGIIENHDFTCELKLLKWITEDEKHKNNFVSMNTIGEIKLNQYNDILPYKYNIVNLDNSKNEINADNYINASYITNPLNNKQKIIIATQTPLKDTINSFWKMIYNNKIKLIIMLSDNSKNEEKNMKLYFPKEKGNILEINNSENSKIKIELIHQEDISPDCAELKIFKINDEYELKHIQILSWPNKGLPGEIFMVGMLMEKLYKHYEEQIKNESPTVIHCYDGVGRTGTVACIFLIITQRRNVRHGNTAHSPCGKGAMQLSKVTILPLRITKGILRLILLREERCSSLTKELRASSR